MSSQHWFHILWSILQHILLCQHYFLVFAAFLKIAKAFFCFFHAFSYYFNMIEGFSCPHNIDLYILIHIAEDLSMETLFSSIFCLFKAYGAISSIDHAFSYHFNKIKAVTYLTPLILYILIHNSADFMMKNLFSSICCLSRVFRAIFSFVHVISHHFVIIEGGSCLISPDFIYFDPFYSICYYANTIF